EAERERIAAALEVAALEAGGLAGEHGSVARELDALDERFQVAGTAVALARGELSARQSALGGWRDAHAAAERERTAAAVHAAAVGERLRAGRAETARSARVHAELAERVAVLLRQRDEAAAGALAADREATAAEKASSD